MGYIKCSRVFKKAEEMCFIYIPVTEFPVKTLIYCSEKALQVKAFATKPEYLSVIARIHMKNQSFSLPKLSSDIHTYPHTHA